jgi:hypothetical protein
MGRFYVRCSSAAAPPDMALFARAGEKRVGCSHNPPQSLTLENTFTFKTLRVSKVV